jgi:uncharacterized membrane protein (UPF0127 family)
MSWIRSLLLAVGLALAALAADLAPVGAQNGEALVGFEKSVLTIETANGPQRFDVELALNSRQQQQGLMYRRSMPANAGMLFVYDGLAPVSMWMKNTFIPLDMLFIDGEGRIVRIVERTVPHSLETISAGRPVNAVLELNGGTASRLGIKPGDRVVTAAIKGSPGRR